MMLAMLPSFVPHHDGLHHVPGMSSVNVTLSQPSIPGGSSQVRPSRPILALNTTLNTSKPRTFGKGSSLSLKTLSAESPTIKNTFVNAYEPIPETIPTIRPKLFIDPAVGQSQDFSSSSDQGSSRTSSNSSASSASTAFFEQQTKLVVNQRIGIASILVTSLTHRSYQTRMSDDRPGLASKRVSFRDPIDEEIKTLRYVMAHSDIQFDSSSEASYPVETPSTATKLPKVSTDNNTDQPVFDFQVQLPPTKEARLSLPPRQQQQESNRTRLRTVTRRDSSPAAPTRLKRDSSSDEDSDDAMPQTPIAGRCKKRREWAWTLDPLPGQKSYGDGEKAEDIVVSHDDDSVSTSSRLSGSSTS